MYNMARWAVSTVQSKKRNRAGIFQATKPRLRLNTSSHKRLNGVEGISKSLANATQLITGQYPKSAKDAYRASKQAKNY